eukprot:5140590-Alexandrium_andersonii.AAC.1
MLRARPSKQAQGFIKHGPSSKKSRGAMSRTPEHPAGMLAAQCRSHSEEQLARLRGGGSRRRRRGAARPAGQPPRGGPA